jgi:ankyrin repeat protein
MEFKINLMLRGGEDIGRVYKKSIFIYCFTAILVLYLMQILVAGCNKGPDTARKELSSLNVQYTPEQFFNNAKNGDTRVVKLFIEAGMDPNVKNADGQTALMFASYSGHTETVKLLLGNGASINTVDKFGDSALTWADAEKHTDIVQLLKKAEISKTY